MPTKRKSRTVKSGTIVLGVAVSPQMHKRVMDLIKEGRYKNASDFLWSAVKNQLELERKKKTHELIRLK